MLTSGVFFPAPEIDCINLKKKKKTCNETPCRRLERKSATIVRALRCPGSPVSRLFWAWTWGPERGLLGSTERKYSVTGAPWSSEAAWLLL